MRFDVAHGEDFDKSRAVILASLEPPMYVKIPHRLLTSKH
jgi:hypothetical protein